MGFARGLNPSYALRANTDGIALGGSLEASIPRTYGRRNGVTASDVSN
jgi:hypothetical protein